MSLAARCTHCHTVFRITGAHLAAAQGWVRCGGCSQVFDAASNLVTPTGQALEVPTVSTRDTAPAPTAAPVAPVGPAMPFQAMPDIDLELPDLGALKAEANTASSQRREEDLAPPRVTTDAAPSPEDLGVQALVGAEPTPQVTEPAADAVPAQRIDPHFDASADLRGDMALSTNAARSEEHPASGVPTQPTASGLSGAAFALLLITLGLLAAYSARGHIAQTWPQARPVVLQVCATLGCQLPALRNIEAVKVQGSSLSRDDTSGHHRLRIQLLNADDVPVLMPAFDLTLVNAQGEVLARRMIDPTELQPAMTKLNPGGEADLSITLDLAALDSISSFRLTAYYP